jgi:hypothetical protein
VSQHISTESSESWLRLLAADARPQSQPASIQTGTLLPTWPKMREFLNYATRPQEITYGRRSTANGTEIILHPYRVQCHRVETDMQQEAMTTVRNTQERTLVRWTPLIFCYDKGNVVTSYTPRIIKCLWAKPAWFWASNYGSPSSLRMIVSKYDRNVRNRICDNLGQKITMEFNPLKTTLV